MTTQNSTPSPQHWLIAKDIMTSGLVTLRPEMSPQEALQVLVTHGISGAPVVNDLKDLLGVASLKDLLANSDYQLPMPSYYEETYLDQILEEEGFQVLNLGSMAVEECMSQNVITVLETATVESVAKVLYTQKIHRVMVMDASHRLTGIITTFDILKAVASGSLCQAMGVPVSEGSTRIPAGLGV